MDMFLRGTFYSISKRPMLSATSLCRASGAVFGRLRGANNLAGSARARGGRSRKDIVRRLVLDATRRMNFCLLFMTPGELDGCTKNVRHGWLMH
jgi:hypothetical protein